MKFVKISNACCKVLNFRIVFRKDWFENGIEVKKQNFGERV